VLFCITFIVIVIVNVIIVVVNDLNCTDAIDTYMLLSLYDGILCQIEPYPGGTRFAASAGKVLFSNHLSTTYYYTTPHHLSLDAFQLKIVAMPLT